MFQGKNFLKSLALNTGIFILLLAPAQGAKFSNQFTEFELPTGWQCNLEGAEWVCQNTADARKKEAIIVLAAKLKGDQDSIDQYLTYLKAAKTFSSVQGKPVKSDPKYAKTVNINGQPWVDSLHLESELPGFYTRYLATVKQDIGVLITFSVNKNKYQQYLSDMDNLVKTLSVFRKAGGINVAPQQGTLFQNNANNQVPTNITSEPVFSGNSIEGGSDQPATPTQKSNDLPLPLILGGVALVAFILWKRRQNRD